MPHSHSAGPAACVILHARCASPLRAWRAGPLRVWRCVRGAWPRGPAACVARGPAACVALRTRRAGPLHVWRCVCGARARCVRGSRARCVRGAARGLAVFFCVQACCVHGALRTRQARSGPARHPHSVDESASRPNATCSHGIWAYRCGPFCGCRPFQSPKRAVSQSGGEDRLN
jgi:hypothetical protein